MAASSVASSVASTAPLLPAIVAPAFIPDPLRDRDTKVLIACHCKIKHQLIYVHEHFIQDIGKAQNTNNFTIVEEYYNNPPSYIDIECKTQLDPSQRFIQFNKWAELPHHYFDVIWTMYCPIFGEFKHVLHALLSGATQSLKDYGMLIISLSATYEARMEKEFDKEVLPSMRKLYFGPIDTVLKKYESRPLNHVYIFQKIPQYEQPSKPVVGSVQQFYQNLIQQLQEDPRYVLQLEAPQRYNIERRVLEHGLRESAQNKTHHAFFNLVRYYYYLKTTKLQEMGVKNAAAASPRTYFEFMTNRLHEADFDVKTLQRPFIVQQEQHTFDKGVLECVNFQQLVDFVNLVHQYDITKAAQLNPTQGSKKRRLEDSDGDSDANRSTILRQKLNNNTSTGGSQ